MISDEPHSKFKGIILTGLYICQPLRLAQPLRKFGCRDYMLDLLRKADQDVVNELSFKPMQQ